MESGIASKQRNHTCKVIVIFHFILELTLRVVCVAAAAAEVIGVLAFGELAFKWSFVTGTSGINALIPRI